MSKYYFMPNLEISKGTMLDLISEDSLSLVIIADSKDDAIKYARSVVNTDNWHIYKEED